MARFLSGLLELSLAAGVLIALLLALTPVLVRRFSPRWRYWAWLVLALRLAVPFNLTLPAPLVTLSAPVLTAPGASAPADAIPAGDVGQTAADALPAGTENGSPAGERQAAALPSAQTGASGAGSSALARLRQALQPSGAIFALWAAGALATLAIQLLRHRAFLRLCRRWRKAASPALQAEADRRAGALGLRRSPALYRCASVSTPMLTGLFRPVILLPPELDGEALALALDHELTHQKRRDLWYKALLLWVRSLYWFHPLVWLMGRRAEGDLEQCCDWDLLAGRSLRDRQAYGRVLLDQMTAGRAGCTRLTTGFSGSRREALARFRVLLDTSARKKGRAALALVAALALLGGGLVACQTQERSGYDGGNGQYSSSARGFSLSIPQTVWDQLTVLTDGEGDEWTVSFVSTEVQEALGSGFDPAEDYWLQVRQFRSDDGSLSRTAAYGAWSAAEARCRTAGLDQSALDGLADLYAAAAEAYRSFVFSTADGDAGSVTQRAGGAYYEDSGTYLSFDLDFGLSLSPEVNGQLDTIVRLSRNSGGSVVFLDRQLLNALGWDAETAADAGAAFLTVDEILTADGSGRVLTADAGDPLRVLELLKDAGAEQDTLEAITERQEQAETIAATLFDLSSVDDGLAEGDSYDPRLTYSYRARDGQLLGALPGWVAAQLQTSYEDGLLVFSTRAGDPLLYWNGTDLTLPALSSGELADASEDGALAYLDLQNTLLLASWTTGGGSISLGTALTAGTACPDGTYQASPSDVSLSDGEDWLFFQPQGQTGGYYLPFAPDAELTPLFELNLPEGETLTPNWVVFSVLLSSVYPSPLLEITVEQDQVTAFSAAPAQSAAE